jgi:hypothetical protein
MSVLFPVTDEMRMIFKSQYNGTANSIEVILKSLKEKGISQMQSLKLIMDEMKLSISEADNIVMHSNAWGNEKEGNEIFRENFLNVNFLSDEPNDEIGDVSK